MAKGPGFHSKELAVYEWAGGELVTSDGPDNHATATVGKGLYEVTNLGAAIVWVRGDTGSSAPDIGAAHSVPLLGGDTKVMWFDAAPRFIDEGDYVDVFLAPVSVAR